MSDHPGPPRGDNSRIFRVGRFFRQLLGAPARKVPLDAGLSCPNRDGTLSRAGCAFCTPAGSGTGSFAAGLPLEEQWDALTASVHANHPGARLIAYLQAYTNTHCKADVLRELLARIALLPGVSGVCLGTRPDCLDVDGDHARLEVLAELAHNPNFPFVQLDLGLQSADDAVLARMNRGHDAACFARAVRAAAERGVFVCAHVVDGLPGAADDDLLRSVAFLNRLPISGIKFHNPLVCRGTELARLWRAGEYAPPSLAVYMERLGSALALLRPDICVERLNADPLPGELLAPDWALDKNYVLTRIDAELNSRDIWQGQDYWPEVDTAGE